VRVRLNTSAGEIVLELDAERAPGTVENFARYVREGFYDGTIFHRVIDGFMIQGGGFEPGMRRKKSGDSIRNEADNGLRNEEGTIAMARTPDPHSASSQFFINANDNDFLDHESKSADGWGYCVFGRVVEGMSVVHAINEVRTGSRSGHRDVPMEDVHIESAVLEDE